MEPDNCRRPRSPQRRPKLPFEASALTLANYVHILGDPTTYELLLVTAVFTAGSTAIGIGGLVPAAIMSIAASNLFTRTIYVPFIHPACTPAQETQNAKLVSLVVKVGALVFIIFLPLQYAIQLQLLGGIWISQTIPTVIFGLYTRWFNPWALLIGWAAGLAVGTWMAGTTGFQSAVFPLQIDGLTIPGYAALYALAVNFAVSILLTLVLSPIQGSHGSDQTAASDYHFNATASN